MREEENCHNPETRDYGDTKSLPVEDKQFLNVSDSRDVEKNVSRPIIVCQVPKVSVYLFQQR